MLALDSHFACLISLQSHWETITSQSMPVTVGSEKDINIYKRLEKSMIWFEVAWNFCWLLYVVLLRLCS